MSENIEVVRKYNTAWHPLLVFTIEKAVPSHHQVLCEVPLNRLPQKIDIVMVMERDDAPPVPARKLRSIFDGQRKHTLIEYKGVTDDLEAADATTLLSYAGQYMTMHRIFDPEEMCLMVLADSISAPFVHQVKRLAGTFECIGNGVWRGRLAGLPLHGVAFGEAYKASPSERMLYFFTRAFLKDPRQLIRLNELDEEEIRLYRLLRQHVQQFRSNPMTMDLKDLDIATDCFDRPHMQLLLEDLKSEYFLSRVPVEQRLAGLAPEQRLAGLAPEQRLAGLAPEQRLVGLTPEQLLAGLTPEQLKELLVLASNKMK